MLHSHLTTLNAVSLVLDAFSADGIHQQVLLAGSGIASATCCCQGFKEAKGICCCRVYLYH